MSDSDFQALLRRLGEAIGVASLEADDDNYCLLTVDDEREISIEFDAERDALILSIGCGTLRQPASVETLTELLAANYHWIGSGGGTLSLYGQGEVALQISVPVAQLEVEQLKDLLEALVHNAEFWCERLQAEGNGTTVEKSAVPDERWPGLRV